MLCKLPPEADVADHRRRPVPDPLPLDLGTWTFLAQVESKGRFRLEKTKRGVNVYFLVTERPLRLLASWHMSNIVDVSRGFRAIQRRQAVFQDYEVIETDEENEFFLCSLPHGEYHVTPRIDGDGCVLWWYDSCYNVGFPG